jgi:glycosyltransferase involved in cell wall biosynthesis
VLCSKSLWHPAIRREHALSLEAAADGVRVNFIERPADIRRAASAARRVVGMRHRVNAVAAPNGVTVTRRSTVVPGHHGPWAERSNSFLLCRTISKHAGDSGVVVAMAPWDWPAVSAAAASRRIFDCTDDWARLMPRRAARIREICRQIGDEADEIIVTSPALAGLFGGRNVVSIPNGVDETLTRGAPTDRPGTQRLAYVGTLSERFDADLVAKVMRALPGWTLDLYGERCYARDDGVSAAALRHLLAGYGGRVRWHGLVERSGLAAVLDEADVLILPNKTSLSIGQSSMKLYDYAARGRPIVSTLIDVEDGYGPPGAHYARGADEFAAAVLAASQETFEQGRTRSRWASNHTWEVRWETWRNAVLGSATH